MENTYLERKATRAFDDIQESILELINEIESKESEIDLLNQQIADLTERNIELDNIIWSFKHP